jgi:hypothetical protein
LTILYALPVRNNRQPWQERLLSEAFLQPPWHDQHPARQQIAQELPADLFQLARVMDTLVDQLSLQALVASYVGRGDPPHRPDLMLKAVLFLVQRGIHSPAEWFFQAHANRVVRWLLRGLCPSRARWYAFRQRLVAFIDDLNKQLLDLAGRQGLLAVQVPVLDGSLLAANATRHKLLNEPTLLRRLGQLEQAIAAEQSVAVEGPALDLAATAGVAGPLRSAPVDASNGAAAPSALPLPPTPAVQAVAVSETAGATTNARSLPQPVQPAGAARAAATLPGWMAKTPQGREQQQQRYQEAFAELAKRLEQNANRRKEDRKPREQVRISPGDPEASLGLDKERVYRPIYNIQVACDLDSDFYLAYDVFSGKQDGATLLPMVERLKYFLPGTSLHWLLTDAGYASGPNLRALELATIALLAPWQENDWTPKQGKKQLPKSAFTWDAQRQTYICPEGHALIYERTQTKQRADRQERHQQYRCPAAHCLHCPRQAACTSRPQSGRMVVRNEYEEEVQRLKARMQTHEAKELYRKRKEQVERRLADSKGHRRLRRLSMRGKEGARLQLGLTALASNIVTFHKRATAADSVNASLSAA